MTATRSTILITGASSGIGYGIAGTFLQAGWNVVANARNADRLHRAVDRLGFADRVAAVVGTTSDAATGAAMVAAARERFGGVDMLVNNAGEFTTKSFLDVTERDLDHFYTVNLKGTFVTTQAAVRAMQAQGRGGNIVNIGTVLAGHGMSWIHASAALVSKGGIHALTVALAAELSHSRIRVNCVAPSFVRTPLMEGGDETVLARPRWPAGWATCRTSRTRCVTSARRVLSRARC